MEKLANPEEIAAAVLDQLRRPLIPSNPELPSWDVCASHVLALYHHAIDHGLDA